MKVTIDWEDGQGPRIVNGPEEHACFIVAEIMVNRLAKMFGDAQATTCCESCGRAMRDDQVKFDIWIKLSGIEERLRTIQRRIGTWRKT